MGGGSGERGCEYQASQKFGRANSIRIKSLNIILFGLVVCPMGPPIWWPHFSPTGITELPKHPWIEIVLLRPKAVAAWSPVNKELVLPSETEEKIALASHTCDGSSYFQYCL